MSRSALFSTAMSAYDEDRQADALELMEVCASKGDPVACYLTAYWYRNGEGAEKNAEKSRFWLDELTRLAEGQNAEAQWELSSKFRWGNLCAVDIHSANYWLERSAENGWGEAQHHLAWYLETGQYGYDKDSTAAEQWYQRAFAQDHPETIYNFALREFKDGKITERAIALLQNAASKGFSQATHVLREYRQ